MTLPTAPSRTMSQDTFDSTTDAFIGALPQFETDMNALAAAMTLNATTDTSATSNTIGTGAKTFTVSASKSFWPGMWLVIADTAAPTTNAMFVQVTSYSGTTLVVNSYSVAGSGTITSWQISQSAPANLGGLYASVTGATFTGLVNLASGANIASAATVDLTAATGNAVTITGTTATSALTMNDGQQMTLVAAAAWPLTYNATTCKVMGGTDYICVAGERVTAFKTGGAVIVIPEYVVRAPKIITFTRDMTAATGTVAYTGVGFRPRSVRFLGIIDGTLIHTSGFDNGTEAMCTMQIYTGNLSSDTAQSLYFLTAATANQKAKISAFSNDGFTLSWEKTNSPTGTAVIIAEVH